jgi:hypothetical protein
VRLPRLPSIPGSVPQLALVGSACTFAARCELAGYDMPISPGDLERIARYGDPAHGAVLAVAPSAEYPAEDQG